MDYSIWKSVLLDWVNSTGFLVQNYQNLHDTHIGGFFEALKKQIKSVSIKSEDVISFLGDYYKDYLIRMDDGQSIPTNEYIYIYSLFMHFACIQYPDSGIQTICKNMVQKNQEIIEKFLECLIRINKCDRLILQNAIDEAENFDTSSYKSPTSRQLQSVLKSSTSPQTPKTKMLNSWNLENRNLKAQLETERFERGYLEMQLNQCEKKLAKLDEDFKSAMIENHDLKKQVQSLDEMSSDSSQTTESDKTKKRFQRELSKKENEIERLTVSCNDARDEIESLKEQIAYAQTQVKSLDSKVLESLDEIQKFKNELENRDKMIDYLTNNNEELSELLKELQSSKRKPDNDSSASCEMLESTPTDLNSSSFYVPCEENLASSIIDIRLIDQQKLNLTLNETINQLQNELATIQADAFRIYSSFVDKNEHDRVESPSVGKILADINERCSQLNEANEILSKNIGTQNVRIATFKEEKAQFEKELAENTTTIDVLQKSIDSLNEKLRSIENVNKELLGAHQGILVELETTKSSLTTCETQRAELNASLDALKEEIEKVQSERRTESARHFDELRTLTSEHEKKIENLEFDRDALIQEQSTLQSKLNHFHQELDQAKDALVAKSSECDDVAASKMALEMVFTENEAKHLAISSKLDECEKELNALRLIKINLERDIETHETAKSKLNKQLDERKNELNNQADFLAQLKTEKQQFENDISELKAEIQAKVETSKEVVENFNKEKMEMEASLNQLRAKLAELEKVNTIHVKTEQNLSIELKKVQEEVEAKQTKITTINSTVDELNDNIKSLQSQIDSLTQSKSVMKQEIDEFTQKCSSLEKTLNNKEQEIQNLRTNFDKKTSTFSTEGSKLNEQLADVNNNYKEAKKRIEILEEEKSKCLRDIVELRSIYEEERKNVEEQLEKVRDELEIASSALDCKTDETNVLQAKFDAAQLELKQTANALTDVRSEIETVSSVKLALEETLVKLQSSHDDEHENIGKQLEKVRGELKMVGAALDHKTEENNALQAKFESSQKELEQTISALKEVRSEIEIISAAKSVLEVSLEELQSLHDEEHKKTNNQLEKVRDELKMVSAALDSNTEENNAIQAKFDSTQLELEQTVKTLKDIRSEIEIISSAKSVLEESLQKSENRTNELEKTIASNAEIEQKLTSELKSVQEEITNKQSKIETLSSDKEKLNESLKTSQEEIESLRQSKSNVEQQLMDVKQKCVSLENEIQEKQNQMETEKFELEAKVAKLTEGEKTLQVQLADSTHEHEKAKEQIETLSQEKDKYLQEIVEVRSLYETKCKESEQEIAQIKGEIQRENALVDSLKTEQEELNKQISTLTVQLEEKSVKLISEQATKVGEIAKLESQIKEISDESAEKANQLEQSVQEMANMEANFKVQIDELSNEREKLTVAIESQNVCLQKLNDQIAEIKSEKADLIEKADSIEKELTEVRDELNTVNKEKNSLVSKIIQLNRTIDEQMQQLSEEKTQLENQLVKVNEQLAAIEDEKQSLEKSIEKMKAEYSEQLKTNDSLKQENETLAAKIEDCAHETEQSKVAMSNLQDENRRLIQSASKQGEVQALKEQLNQIQKQIQERADNWKKEKEALIQDNKIYRAKLMKEREIIEKKENEHRETRTEYEVKLEKMKEKMKTLYKEEMAKVKDKHEKDFNEAIAENRRCIEKIEAYESKLQKISTQIHRLNEEKLQLWKDNEMMKTKLRSVNINFQLNGNSTSNMFEGGTFKMEDEEGELFDNTYLDELKGGGIKTGLPPTGRESLTLDEINRRNSMVPPHLRSSYMPQFTNPIEESKNDENLRSLDDSMFSTQSETRRLTLYKKPGPPTPNKNSARLSVGATSDLPRGDILREQNGNDRASMGGGSSKSTARKSTPGKFRSIFSSSKSKDEANEKENDEHLLQRLLITSTPRRHTRRSSLPRFESTNSIRSTENSISRLRLPDWENISQSLISKTRPSTSRRIQWSIGMDVTSPDSTSPQHTPKVIPSKKSARRRRSSVLAKKSLRLNWRKEKRQAIYNQTRRISKMEHVIDEVENRTFSITGSSRSATVTVPSSGIRSIGTNFGSEHEEIEIRNFQAEVNQHKGPLEISTEYLNVIDSIEEQNNFEKLCNNKRSHCPFVEAKAKAEKSLLKECINKIIGQNSSDDNNQLLLMPPAERSSSGIAARISSHCARICWNQQRIPQVHTYKVEKRAQDTSVKNGSTVSSTHSSFLHSVEALHTSISDGWNELPTFVQYYMIAITLCLISNIYFRINK